MSNTRTINSSTQGVNFDGHKLMDAYQIHTAAKNIQRYVKEGIIVDGKVTGHWPKRKDGHNLMVRGDAKGTPDAIDDLAFFTDGWCSQIIDRWGFKTTSEAILKRALSGKVANLDLCGGEA